MGVYCVPLNQNKEKKKKRKKKNGANILLLV